MAFEYTPEQIAVLLDKLSQPFDPKDVKWRVTNKTRDGKKGMVAAYADPRAYSARLNEVFTPAGWSFDLTTETTTGLTRMRNGKSVPTGKVSVIATLEIFGISKKASTGEMWADDDNALTRAEAQAKKRAASMFGLGEYFYELKSLGSNLWVPLDEKGNPTCLPQLPAWALPGGMKPASRPQASAPQTARPPVQQGQQRSGSASQGQSQSPRQNGFAQMTQSERVFREGYREVESFLGVKLANDVLNLVTGKFNAGALKGDKYEVAMQKLKAAAELLGKVRSTAEEQHSKLDAILEHYKVENLASIPTYQALYLIAMDLEVVPKPEKKAA